MTYTSEQIAARWTEVREIRNNKLRATDEMVVKAAELGVAPDPAVVSYRQALRDITGQPDPFSITWPAIDDAVFSIPVTAVTMRQARLALANQGLLSQIDAAIATLPSAEQEIFNIEWEYATMVEPSSAWVTTMAQALNLSEADLDALFALARTY